jgi:hypothetical protein
MVGFASSQVSPTKPVDAPRNPQLTLGATDEVCSGQSFELEPFEAGTQSMAVNVTLQYFQTHQIG